MEKGSKNWNGIHRVSLGDTDSVLFLDLDDGNTEVYCEHLITGIYLYLRTFPYICYIGRIFKKLSVSWLGGKRTAPGCINSK